MKNPDKDVLHPPDLVPRMLICDFAMYQFNDKSPV